MQTTQLTVNGQRLTFGPDRRFTGGDDEDLLWLLNYRAETSEPPSYGTHAEDANSLCSGFVTSDFVTTGDPPERYVPDAIPGFPPPPP